MELVQKITIGVVVAIIGGIIIWFVYSKFSKKNIEQNFLNQMSENVAKSYAPDIPQTAIDKIKMIQKQEEKVLTKDKKNLKTDRSYRLADDVNSFTFLIECKSFNMQLANSDYDLVSNITVNSDGRIVVDNVEYSSLVEKGDKMIIITVVDGTLTINRNEIRKYSDNVKAFNFNGEGISSTRFSKINSDD